MKEFMLLIRNQLGHHESLSAEQEQAFVEKCMLYIDKLTKDGKLKAAQPMERQGAMLSGTKGAWKEGPFHETKEVLVGYYHILARDMQEAIDLAKGNPEFEYSSTARIEIRPVKTKEKSTNYVYPDKA
ncbi:MAG TPA: YciI family protein [Puia sp.]